LNNGIRGFISILLFSGYRAGQRVSGVNRSPVISGSTIRQTAIFDPVGLAGLAYWYALYPLHQLVFDGMLRRIAASVARQSWDRTTSARRIRRSRG
jgi:hypothetical protein